MDQKEQNEIMPSMSISRHLEMFSTPAKTSQKREWNSVYIVFIHTLLQFSYDDCDCVPYFAVVNSALSYLIAHLFHHHRYLNGRFSQFHVLGIGSQYMLTTHDHSFWSPAGLAFHTALSMWPLWNILLVTRTLFSNLNVPTGFSLSPRPLYLPCILYDLMAAVPSSTHRLLSYGSS